MRLIRRFLKEIEKQSQIQSKPLPILSKIRSNPELILSTAGIQPDPWQIQFLRNQHKRQTLLCSRRTGKTTAACAKVLAQAINWPNQTILIFSPTQRQSTEFLRTVRNLNRILGKPVPYVTEAKTEIELVNGSRIISLPDSPDGVVGYTPTLLVIDEASRVTDQLYFAVRPMLVLGSAGLITLSTPLGKRGWFFEVWNDQEKLSRYDWHKVTAYDCPRIGREALEEERKELGERWFAQEFLCSFEEDMEAVFSWYAIQRAFDENVEPIDFSLE